ncbi:LemA family protein [Leptolyngbya sp. NIES-2104]|uniref:LemA family protein n=1 Tax=Leptolyngbya sp. NIES-2104 TaxID=1552121 RepID=UPI0006ECAB52|nr:LemA family protein [Leptolyngbya sp. NIES-2104]GAP97311.1 LemA protein [Leptolyngbya sp. NIES-2104]
MVQVALFLLATIVIGAIALAITIWVLYNGLIAKKNDVERSFSSIDVILKKRIDLIPNLVASVQTYMKFEQQTLTEVTRLRSQVMTGGTTRNERIDLENQISRSLGNILVLSENYPELKSDTHCMHLQAAIYEIEEQISAARRFYNSAVTEYNNAIEAFPSNLIARLVNYQPRRFFEATEQDRQNVDVNALFNR